MEVTFPKFTSTKTILIVSSMRAEMTLTMSQWDVTCRQFFMVKFIIRFVWTHHIMELISILIRGVMNASH